VEAAAKYLIGTQVCGPDSMFLELAQNVLVERTYPEDSGCILKWAYGPVLGKQDGLIGQQ